MTFKDCVRTIVETEIDKTIRQQGYFLETEFCTNVCKEYNDFTIPTIKLALRRIYPEKGLMKRYLTNELKRFYGLETRGCPIVYMPNK